MAELFKTILLLSCVGTVLGTVLMLCKPVTRKLFSAAWHYYMWLAVLLVMVLPVRLQLPTEPSPVRAQQTAAMVIEENGQLEQETLPVYEAMPADHTAKAPAQTEETRPLEAVKGFFNERVLLLSFVWAIGAVLLFAKKLTGYLVLQLAIRRHSTVISCPQLEAYTRRRITVRTGSNISSPFMAGLVKPTLLLPDVPMTETQLQHVLAHEMVHFKRGDMYYKWFAGFVKCMHWFNPAIYWMSHRMNLDCEVSCDLAVVRDMNREEEKSYIDTILALVASPGRSIPLTTGMAGGKQSLKERFTMIKNRITVSRKMMVLSAVLAVMVVFGTVLVSGALNGRLLPVPDQALLSLSADEREGEVWNTLVIGTDEKGRADAILLISCNGDILASISIPRHAAFGGDKRISEYLAEENGDQLVLDAIREAFDIPISYYARIDLHAVEKMIDSVGGLEIDVPMDMVYEDPYQDLQIDLKKGTQQLTGQQVSQLLRYRSGYADGEFSRMAMHQTVIEAFIRQKLIGGKLSDIAEIYSGISQGIQTNYPLETFIKDSRRFKKLDLAQMKFDIIPGGNVAAENGLFTYQIDFERANELLEGFRPGADSAGLRKGDAALMQTHQAAREPDSLPASGESEDAFVSRPQETVLAAVQERKAAEVQQKKIKSTTIAEDAYPGFEHVMLEETGLAEIRQELMRRGITESTERLVDLQKNFTVQNYSRTDNYIKCDGNGNISLYFSSAHDELMEICFYDAETETDVGQYCILADGEAVYSFLGFDRNKSYRLTIQKKTRDDWQFEGEYIIF